MFLNIVEGKELAIQAWSNVAMALIALIALIVALSEYYSHKRTDKHKLFSQLNKRYQENVDIQCVVKYLREIEPSDIKPTLYQLELFLRFFEELGMYVETDSLKSEDVNKFFCYYLNRLYNTSRGKELLSPLEGEVRSLCYLNALKEKTSKYQ